MLATITHWVQPTLAGLVALFVLFILLGWLVPVRWLRREREIAEYYRKAAEASDARADKLADMLADQLKQRPAVRR